MSTSNAAVELMKRNQGLNPDRIAYYCGEREFTFRRLDRTSLRFAILIRKLGITPGDRILVLLPDRPAFPAAFLGCILAGAIAVPVDPLLPGNELEHIVRDCGCRIIITDADGAARFNGNSDTSRILIDDQDAPAEDPGIPDDLFSPHIPSRDDFAYMLYTSGSTGLPKGVPHRHRDLLLPCELVGKFVLGLTCNDVIFSTSKLPFAYGLINSLAFPLRFGASAVLHPGKPAPSVIMEIIRRRRPTVFFSVPPVYSRLVLSCADRELELPMRLCCSAGESLPTPLFEEWQRLTGLEILDGIGCTETAYHFISNLPGRAMPGSAGRLLPGYRARIVDEYGKDLPEGREGNLLVSGETLSPFYWNLPERSARAMGPDGFLKTGDIFVERDGFFYHRGRSDDMFKSGGLWVSPLPVEDVIGNHPAVAECAVAAVKVGAMTAPGAFVLLAEGWEPTPGLALELRRHVAGTLPPHMRPVRIRFLEELPRTATGKLRRSSLKEGYWTEG